MLLMATGEHRFSEGFNRELDYLLSGQYDNGGWSQFWPDNEGYEVHITFNDPLWARFYDLKIAVRNGIPCERLDQIGPERRHGYSWYNDRPTRLYPL